MRYLQEANIKVIIFRRTGPAPIYCRQLRQRFNTPAARLSPFVLLGRAATRGVLTPHRLQLHHNLHTEAQSLQLSRISASGILFLTRAHFDISGAKKV
jgi:hypothetical protein